MPSSVRWQKMFLTTLNSMNTKYLLYKSILKFNISTYSMSILYGQGQKLKTQTLYTKDF